MFHGRPKTIQGCTNSDRVFDSKGAPRDKREKAMWRLKGEKTKLPVWPSDNFRYNFRLKARREFVTVLLATPGFSGGDWGAAWMAANISRDEHRVVNVHRFIFFLLKRIKRTFSNIVHYKILTFVAVSWTF